jgi:hypothetical protein
MKCRSMFYADEGCDKGFDKGFDEGFDKEFEALGRSAVIRDSRKRSSFSHCCAARIYICAIRLSPNSEHLISVAPSIKRAKS